MGKTIDLTGQRFGQLTVVERVENYISPKGSHRSVWKCICDCGNLHCATASALKRGYTKSCGCLRREVSRKRVKDLMYLTQVFG